MTSPVRRCALYTRKSSEEGLDQAFNSLDAQREACAAYVRSQAGEGWRAITARYDDGGYSGGSMERPALRQLLGDITAGKVDVVVVYKIDRLTRTLADFARMVEIFDLHGVSFVSVTQAFNTTSSMGRLTLNVLLSFAQFEREVTGERIRDKIAASKARGLWMGGNLPLGYDLPVPGIRALVLNPGEAETVRLIFTTYLELGSVHALERWLAENGIRSKSRVARSGRTHGGVPFNRGALFHLLRNRLYLGMIVHRGKMHPGMHPAIVEPQIFDAVQARLDANAGGRSARRTGVARAPLVGRIFDAEGYPMCPSYSHGRGVKLYRYYVSAPLQQGRRRPKEDPVLRRVAATPLEAHITKAVERLVPSFEDAPLELPSRVEVRQDALRLFMPLRHLEGIEAGLVEGESVTPDDRDPGQMCLALPFRPRRRGEKTVVLDANAHPSRPDPVLVKALRAAHAMLRQDPCGFPTLEAIPATPYRRQIIRLAFLAPGLQRAILRGSQPRDLTLARLTDGTMPPCWHEQRRMFGVERPRDG